MAMSNAERQKRWLEKNRALHNFRRRKKNLSGSDVTARDGGKVDSVVATPSAQPFETKKVGEFRMLVMPTERVEDEPTMPVVKPKIFTNDITGQIISERAWNELQRRKRKAKEGGYEIDEHSQ